MGRDIWTQQLDIFNSLGIDRYSCGFFFLLRLFVVSLVLLWQCEHIDFQAIPIVLIQLIYRPFIQLIRSETFTTTSSQMLVSPYFDRKRQLCNASQFENQSNQHFHMKTEPRERMSWRVHISKPKYPNFKKKKTQPLNQININGFMMKSNLEFCCAFK